MTKPYFPNKEETPYSHYLAEMCNGRRVDVTLSQTQLLNKFTKLLEFREKENKFTNTCSKEAYFLSAMDFINNIILKP